MKCLGHYEGEMVCWGGGAVTEMRRGWGGVWVVAGECAAVRKEEIISWD